MTAVSLERALSSSEQSAAQLGLRSQQQPGSRGSPLLWEYRVTQAVGQMEGEAGVKDSQRHTWNHMGRPGQESHRGCLPCACSARGCLPLRVLWLSRMVVIQRKTVVSISCKQLTGTGTPDSLSPRCSRLAASPPPLLPTKSKVPPAQALLILLYPACTIL